MQRLRNAFSRPKDKNATTKMKNSPSVDADESALDDSSVYLQICTPDNRQPTVTKQPGFLHDDDDVTSKNNEPSITMSATPRRENLKVEVNLDDIDPMSYYQDLAFCFLSKDFWLRSVAIRISLSPYFEWTTMTIILLNCITLGLYDPYDPECYTRKCHILEKLELFIYTYFVLEMLIKMLAFGFFGKLGYLNDGWNRLDLFIVCAGTFEMLYGDGEFLSSVRAVRVLRPLRAINRVPSIRILVTLLLDTLPMLGNVFILCVLVLLVFSIIGVQLWQGILRNRCFHDLNTNETAFLEYNNISLPSYYIPPGEEEWGLICSSKINNGEVRCKSPFLENYQQRGKTCATNLNDFLNFTNTNRTVFSNDPNTSKLNLTGDFNINNKTDCINWNSLYTTCRSAGKNPNWDAISFDNAGAAFIAIFQTITLEGWTDIMYYLQDSYSSWVWVYFVTLIVIGSYFLTNLCLVVVATQFSETRQRESALMEASRRKTKSMASTIMTISEGDEDGCYRQILSLVHHFLRRSYRVVSRKIYAAVMSRRKKFKGENSSVHFHHHHHHHIHHHHLHLCPNSADKHRRFDESSASSKVNPPSICIDDMGDEDIYAPLATMTTIAAPGKQTNSLIIPNASTTESDASISTINEDEIFQPLGIGGKRTSLILPENTVVICHSSTTSIASVTALNAISMFPMRTQSFTEGDKLKESDIKLENQLVKVSNKLGDSDQCDRACKMHKSSYDQRDSYNNNNALPVNSRRRHRKRERKVTRCNTWQAKVQRFCETKVFRTTIMLSIFLNSITMACEHYEQPDLLTSILDVFNLIFTLIFTVECCTKLFGYGFYGYIKDPFNVFDGVIVIISIVELAGPSGGGGGVSVLRTFRLMRIFKLIRFMPMLQKQIKVMLSTLDSVMTFLGLLTIFMFTSAILGMHLFGASLKDDEGHPARHNFDNLMWSLITVFQVLTQEDWNAVLYDAMRGTSKLAAVYFVLLMIIGNYILFNLLVAILVEGFSTETKWYNSNHEHIRGIKDRELGGKFEIFYAAIFYAAMYFAAIFYTIKDGILSSTVTSPIPTEHQIILNRSITSTTINKGRTVPTTEEKQFCKSCDRIHEQESTERACECKIAEADDNTSYSVDPCAHASCEGQGKLQQRRYQRCQERKDQQDASERYADDPTVDFCNAELVDLVGLEDDYPDEASDSSMQNRLLKCSQATERMYFDAQQQTNIEDSNNNNNKNHYKSMPNIDNCSPTMYLRRKSLSESAINKQVQFGTLKIKKIQPSHKKTEKKRSSSCCWDGLRCCRVKLLEDRKDWSLYIFSPRNRNRQKVQKMVAHPWFDNFVLFFIACNCIIMALERPGIVEGSTERIVIDYSNHVFTIVFTLEMLIKIYALGFVCGEKTAYLRSGWNRIDFVLVIVSLSDLFITYVIQMQSSILGVLKVFRAFRTLRPLRVISRAPGLKIVVETLIASLAPIGNLVVVGFVFFSIFGILGVQLFKGKFYFCKGSSVEVETRDQCALNGGVWANKKYTFDNLFQALFSLFVFATKDGWVSLMYDGIDAVGIGKQPIRNHNPWAFLYFVSFLLIAGFVVINMVVGVIIDNFQKCRVMVEGEIEPVAILEPEAAEDQEPQNLPRYSRMRRKVYNLVSHFKFDLVIAAVIGLNVFLMALEYHQMPEKMILFLKIMNYIFTAIFIIEAVLKIYGFGPRLFFAQRWNQLDVVIVFLSISGIVFEELDSSLPINPTIIRIMRILRIARVLKILKAAAGIQKLLNCVSEAIPQVGNLSMLFGLIFFIFAALGIELFGKLDCDKDECFGISRHAHFKNFGYALLTLFRISTGDNWSGILKDAINPVLCEEPCPMLPYIAPAYFAVFVLASQIVLVNVVVAVLMKQLEDSRSIHASASVQSQAGKSRDADSLSPGNRLSHEVEQNPDSDVENSSSPRKTTVIIENNKRNRQRHSLAQTEFFGDDNDEKKRLLDDDEVVDERLLLASNVNRQKSPSVSLMDVFKVTNLTSSQMAGARKVSSEKPPSDLSADAQQNNNLTSIDENSSPKSENLSVDKRCQQTKDEDSSRKESDEKNVKSKTNLIDFKKDLGNKNCDDLAKLHKKDTSNINSITKEKSLESGEGITQNIANEQATKKSATNNTSAFQNVFIEQENNNKERTYLLENKNLVKKETAAAEESTGELTADSSVENINSSTSENTNRIDKNDNIDTDHIQTNDDNESTEKVNE